MLTRPIQTNQPTTLKYTLLPGDYSKWVCFHSLLFWSLVFYLGLTIFSVPYVAMGYEMSDGFHERTNIMGIAQFIGQWAWVIAPWLWVIMDPGQGFFESGEAAVRELAIWVGLICMIIAMIPAIFIKGKSTLNENFPVNSPGTQV